MNSVKLIQISKRIAAFFLGLFIIQVGVALFLKLNIGSDPFTVFTQGVSKLLHITPGWANRIITVVLLGVVLLFDHKQVKIGTIVSVLCAGTFLDAALAFISPLFAIEMPVTVKLILFLFTSMLIGIGFSTLKSADLGMAPNDSTYFVILDKVKKPYGIVRMAVDSVYMVVGFLFGGVIGIGTVFCILLIGPIVQFCMNHMKPIFDSFYHVQTRDTLLK